MMKLRGLAVVWTVMVVCGCDQGGGGAPNVGDLDFVIEAPGLVGHDGFTDGRNGVPPGGEPALVDDGATAIEEADIVRLDGDRLYALSTRGGLAIVDVSDPGALKVVGRYRAHAEPFEMYVAGERALVMYRELGRYAPAEDGSYTFEIESRLVALDVSDPGHVVELGAVAMPGSISDSRKRGDVLYVVTHEDGYCYGCEAGPVTTITSWDVSDDTPKQIAQVRLPIENAGYGGGERSVYSTDERLYVATPIWTPTAESSSVIDVIDISDAEGGLMRGARVAVAGDVQSRWQMDEFEGVLRVVSQPSAWRTEDEPVVETFTVSSSQIIEPLGSLELVLPEREMLRSARFDGPRAYVITFEQTDPLFTIDLSDPEKPAQRAALEIPGWVYHMVPLGDRLLGFGFDNGNPDGAIHVSLFDVSDLASPELLSRVNFGGDYADFAESQNRIHKALAVLPERDLVLVPFSGYQYDDLGCGSTFRGGVQLVDLKDDALALRGLAPQSDRSRRPVLLDHTLLAVSDSRVQSFDIADRDKPKALSSTAIAGSAYRVVVAGDVLARLATDWSVGQTRLELVPRDEPDSLAPLGELVLDDILELTSKPGVEPGGEPVGACFGYGFYDVQIFARERHLYVLYADYGSTTAPTKLATIDISDPTDPTLVATLALPYALGWGGGYYLPGANDDGARAVQVGAQLVLHHVEAVDNGLLPRSTAWFDVVDLTEPEAPRALTSIRRPDALGHGLLHVFGDQVVSSRVIAVGDQGTDVAFFADRMALADGELPRLLASPNVPGPVVAYDPERARAVTLDYAYEVRQASDASDCYGLSASVAYDYERRRCTLLRQGLSLVRIEGEHAELVNRVDVENELRLAGAIGAGNLVFAVLGPSYGYYGYAVDGVPVGQAPTAPGATAGAGGAARPGAGDAVVAPGGGIGYATQRAEFVTLTGLRSSTLAVASRIETTLDGVDFTHARTLGSRLVAPTYGLGLAVVDASDPEKPEMNLHELYGTCLDLVLDRDNAICALGDYGMQEVPLAGP